MQNYMGLDSAVNGRDKYPPSDLYCENSARQQLDERYDLHQVHTAQNLLYSALNVNILNI